MSAAERKHEFSPFNDTPGQVYRQFKRDLFGHAAQIIDASGSSLADTFEDKDMGGAHVTAQSFPTHAGTAAKMERLRLARNKNAFGLLFRHINDEDIKTILSQQFFQDGRSALAYLDKLYDTPILRSDLRELDKLWTELSIVKDVGVNANSISRYVVLMQRTNGERPAAHRHDDTELAEKLLESIADCSKHFSEAALAEYNAPPGARKFEHPPGHPRAGQRNFLALALLHITTSSGSSPSTVGISPRCSLNVPGSSFHLATLQMQRWLLPNCRRAPLIIQPTPLVL